MVFPELTAWTDASLLLLRLLIAALFGTSGWSHVTKPKQRAESIGLSSRLTIVVGALELLGAGSIALGVYPQIGAILLIGVMLGAIQRKMFVWKSGFWGESGQGWYYDLLYLVCNLVILTTGGGAIAIT